MAGIIERFINVFVDSDDATNKLNNLNTNLEKTVKQTDKLSQSQDKNTKSLRENGGAMGLLGAATGGLSNDFKDAIEAAEGLGVSMKGLRGAIIATGLGALAIVVLELVTNWEKWSSVIDGSAAAMERLNRETAINKTINEQNSIIRDRTVAKLEEELRLEIARNGESKEAARIQSELDKAKIEFFEKQDSFGNTEIDRRRTAVEMAEREVEQFKIKEGILNEIDRLEERLAGRAPFAANQTREEAIERLKILNFRVSESEQGKALLERQKELNQAQIEYNKVLNDPAVRRAQEARLAREKAMAEALKEQLRVQEFIKKIRKEIEDSRQKGGSFDELMNTLKTLQSDDYGKLPFIEAIENSINSIQELELELQRLESTLSDFDKNPLNSFVTSSDTLLDNLFGVGGSLVSINREGTRLAEVLERANEIYETRKSILEETFNIEKNKLSLEEKSVEQQIDKLSNEKKLNKEALETEQTRLNILLNRAQATGTLSENEMAEIEALKKSVIERGNIDNDLLKQMLSSGEKISEIRDQIRATENQKATEFAQIELESFATNEAIKTDILQAAIDARIAEEERYSTSVQTLYSNVYSFLDQLQSEQFDLSRDTRNAILLAVKGAQIAEVVINTVRENAKLKMQAGEYATNAALYGGLAISLGPVNPVAAQAYGSAALQYGIAGSKSLATIPINWGIAGASIASIAATTLTSWNRGGGGGGSSSGGGSSPAAQFNIVGSSQTNQLAATIGAQQNQPVNAYVVGSDVTTQQALDRNRVTNATFL